jgi:hypothetical protein
MREGLFKEAKVGVAWRPGASNNDRRAGPVLRWESDGTTANGIVEGSGQTPRWGTGQGRASRAVFFEVIVTGRDAVERIGAGWLASRQGKRMPWAEGRYSRAGDGIYVQEEKTSEDGDEGIF